MDFQAKKQLPPAIVGRIERREVNDTELVGRKIAATPDFVANVASLVTHTSPTAFPTTASAGSKSEEMLPGKQCPVEKVTRSIPVCSKETELVESCSPLWYSLSVEGRSRYSRESREALGGGVVMGGFVSYGRPLEQIVNRARQEGIEQENMKTDIRSKVDRALMNQKVENECFYLLHTNVHCLTAEGGVAPAELSLTRMSLRKGVEEVYHVLIEPGTLGYRAEYTENSKATHKIPLDLALFNGNYQQIVEEMLEFLRALPDCREFPPLYCMPKYKSQNLLCCLGSCPGCRRTWLWRSGSRCTVSQFCFMSWPGTRTSPPTPAWPCPHCQAVTPRCLQSPLLRHSLTETSSSTPLDCPAPGTRTWRPPSAPLPWSAGGAT